MIVIEDEILASRTTVADRLAETAGRSHPLGATLVPGGANFSIFSRSASGIDLLLFDRYDDPRPSRVIPIDQPANRTHYYWHVFVPEIQPGQIYGFRAFGPWTPSRGLRFDSSKVLLDPYGRAVVAPKDYNRAAAALKGDNTPDAMKSVVDPHAYDWEGDVPLRLPSSRTIIYEMDVRAGIEVILDVVFNHTAEGNDCGPVLSFRGLDNGTYYILGEDRSQYANYSGTGNTLNGNHPIVRRTILDSLHYWVENVHVDGFRFDLASILARDSCAPVMSSPPVLWDIDSDPVLAGTKLIAEAWDAAGLYQVGSFVGDSWKEWNGQFRDDVRDLLRAADYSVTRVADRFLGSPEIYGYKEREVEQSVNFVTCHDGFTLNDLVTYNYKQNGEMNGVPRRPLPDDRTRLARVRWSYSSRA